MAKIKSVFKHNAKDARLIIRAESAEAAEDILKGLKVERKEWSLIAVQDDSGVMGRMGRWAT